jgi:hypothetical protein
MRAQLSVIGVWMVVFAAGCAADVAASEAELRTSCGGFAGFPCPIGGVCVDDPTDACDPALGGVDCLGVCRSAGGRRDCRRGPGVSYVARSPEQCAAIRFVCAAGTEPFFDACGCGCAPVRTPCGPTTCGAGEECCNESCGICTEPGGLCTQQFCEYAGL